MHPARETGTTVDSVLKEAPQWPVRDPLLKQGRGAFEADMGAEAVRKLLAALDLVKLSEELPAEASPEALRDARADNLAHRCRAGRRQQCDPRIVHERAYESSIAARSG